MEDVPQPADEPYSRGDRVRIYLATDDADVDYQGLVCEVVDVYTDNLDEETGRDLDKYSYRLQRVDTDAPLDIEFRHGDLVPATE